MAGDRVPLYQGGMANIATAEFAAAVSNAGALGLIGAGGMPPEVFQESIRRCRSLTDKPFGVNIMLMHPQVEQLAAHRRGGEGGRHHHRRRRSHPLHPRLEGVGRQGDPRGGRRGPGQAGGQAVAPTR